MARGASAESLYLEVPVHNVKGVEIRHRLQHLANHVTGVPLGVVALVQDPVEHLSARGSREKQRPQRAAVKLCAIVGYCDTPSIIHAKREKT